MKRTLMAATAAAIVGAFVLTGTPSFADPGHGAASDTGMQMTAGSGQGGMGSGMMMKKGMGMGPGTIGPSTMGQGMMDQGMMDEGTMGRGMGCPGMKTGPCNGGSGKAAGSER